MEKIFLDKSGIYVSNTHLKSKGTTYIFSHISRVTKQQDIFSRKIETYLILGAILTFGAMFTGIELFLLYLLELVLLLTIFLCYRYRKPAFKIILHVHNENHDFLKSKDTEWLNAVYASIHEAIVHHGFKNTHPFTIEPSDPPVKPTTRRRSKG